MKNGLEIDFTDNPDVADQFSRKRSGDSFELRVKGQINEISDSGVKCTIEKIIVADKAVETDADEPVMMVMRAKTDPEEAEAPEPDET